MSQGFDVVVRDRISASIANKLNRIEQSAIRATQAINQLQSGMGAASGGMGAVGGAAQNATSRVLAFALGLGRAQSNAQLLVGSMRSTGQALRSFASGILLLGATGGIIDQVDGYRTLQNQLRTTTTSQAQLNEVTRQMFEVAQRARVPVDSIATAFTRYDKALAKVGFGQKETLDLTETIAKAFTLSGSNATEASSGLTQLSQAFNKGKLDGDEFRTTAELFPGLLDAVATAFGTTSSEVFKLSKEGKITVDKLVQTFRILKERVDKDFEGMPRTIGQAFTQLGNTINKAFGAFDQKFGFTNSINSFLDTLGNNLPTVVNSIKAFGAAFAVMIVPSVIALFGPVTSFFLSVPGLIAGAAAMLAYFSDEIMVAGDGVTTLSDLMGVLFGNVNNLVGAVGALLGVDLKSWFSAETAQKLYDSLISVGSAFQSGVQYVYAWVNAFKEFLVAASFDSVKQEFTLDWMNEPFRLLFAYIQNGFAEIPIQIIKAFEGPINAAIKLIDNLIKAIGALVNAVGNLSPFGDKFGLGPLADSLSKGMGDSSSQKMIDKFKSLQVDAEGQEKLIPQFTKGMAAFDKAWDSSLATAKSSSDAFWQDIIGQAQDAAQKRIAIEKQVEESTKANPGALRQDDPAIRQRQAQEAELLRFNEALEQAAKKSVMLRDVLHPNTQFADEFKQKMVESALAGENFSKSIIAIGLGLKPLKTDLQSTNTSLEAFNKAAGTSGLVPQGQPGQVPQASVAPATTAPQLEQTNVALQAVMTNATATATAIQNVATAISEIDTVSQTMSASTTGAFNAISSAAFNAGSDISNSISSSMADATAAVSSFASSAIADLNAVANAANSIQAPSGFGGGGGFFGFASGGYTGNGGVNEIAGVVHGREFVMPAGATAQYRPILEAMRAGRPIPSANPASSVGTSASGLNVSVHNYGSSKISVERLSESDIRIIAREEAVRSIGSESPKLMASQLRNPNSTISKSLARNTKSERRR